MKRRLLIAAMLVGCSKLPDDPMASSGEPASLGTIVVDAVTIGDTLDLDGYAVTLDGTLPQALPTNGSVVYDSLAPSGYDVELSQVEVNCAVSSANPKVITVAAGDTAQATFDVVCFAALFNYFVFTRWLGGQQEIHVMRTDGSGVRRLTNSGGLDRDAAFSPDGTQIAFRTDRDGDTEIYVMDSDGSNPVRLTNSPGLDGDQAWSPDGSLLAFRSERDGNSEIYVMHADGSNPVRLTNDQGEDDDPTWSPDQSQIVFGSDRDHPDSEIYVMDSDGSNPIRLTFNSLLDDDPSMSPDGTKILFRRVVGGDSDIHVMNADGSNTINLTNDPSGNDIRPSWSPDGSRIAFTKDSGPEAGLYVMDADGANPMRIRSSITTDDDVDWGPER